MPSFVAFCLATALALVIGFEWEVARWLSLLVGLMVWLGVFSATRRFFQNLRPE